MQTRQLGINGAHVPVICLGTWPLGGGFGKIDYENGIKTIKTSIDEGITFIDTAEGYNDGEKLVGDGISGQRDKVFLATKLSGADHSKQHMITALETSLKLLGTDYIDLYQLHSPQSKWPIEETMRNLLKLKDQGKIRYIGISNFNAEQTDTAQMYGQIHSSQPRYNILFRETEVSTIPFCLKNGIGVIAHSVLAKGLLSGKYQLGSQFAEDDERRKVYGNMTGQQYEKIFGFIEKLSGWASDNGRDLLQLAIAWVNAQPGITSSIIGPKTPEQVLHSAKAGDWNLTQTDLQDIENLKGNLKLDFQQLREDED
tara:strand:+ start:502 stop:1440 length:939 start_codon:yes stop_codon:yes gene_type:complete